MTETTNATETPKVGFVSLGCAKDTVSKPQSRA